MRRQSQTQLTAAVAITLAVTISASVGCVSVHHDWAQHCGFDKFRESKKSYYHCAHCGQIVANPHAKCCPHCSYVKPYYGYEPTCWNKFPEGWGCPNGAQACHPEMLEMVPPVEYSDGIPLEHDSVRIEHEPHHVPFADDAVAAPKAAAPQVAVEDEHAIPSASDRMAPVATPDFSNPIDVDVPARTNVTTPEVRLNDQTQAKPINQKRDLAVLPPMDTSLVDGMIEAPVPQVAPSQSVAKAKPVIDRQDSDIDSKPMVLNFPVPSPERAVTVDKVPSVTRVPVPEVDITPVAKTPEFVSVKSSANVSALTAPQTKRVAAEKPDAKDPATAKDLATEAHASPKVQRITVPQPKTEKLDAAVSVTVPASAKSSKSEPVASQGTFDIPAELWNRIIAMPVAASSGQPMPGVLATESYEMKKSFEPVSIETQSPRLIPTMTNLPKRVPTIPAEIPARVSGFTQTKTSVELPAPVRRIPASVPPLMGENASPAIPTQNVTPAETVAPVVNRIPLGQVAPASIHSQSIAPQHVVPNQVQTNAYPAPANRIQIR
ncbi:hypothetical protein [Novipirellula sp.]|uniref:FYVE zinc finger domain-containing protein n=1 Tax=Novipirellula sp. TaxID=2795430 RepID=UPI003561F94C